MEEQKKIMNAKEFLEHTSPNNKFGVRAALKSHKLEKHVIRIMEMYAQFKIDDLHEPTPPEPGNALGNCKVCGRIDSIFM